MEQQAVNLGDEVKCRVTGFEGVAMGIGTYLHGCRRVSVQPPVDKDGKPRDAYDYDEPNLEVITRGKLTPPQVEPEQIEVDLGDEALDPVSKTKGVVIAISHHWNGCKVACLQIGCNKHGEWQEGIWISAARLKLVGGQKKKAHKPGKRTTGGPVTPTATRAVG